VNNRELFWIIFCVCDFICLIGLLYLVWGLCEALVSLIDLQKSQREQTGGEDNNNDCEHEESASKFDELCRLYVELPCKLKHLFGRAIGAFFNRVRLPKSACNQIVKLFVGALLVSWLIQRRWTT
jgi:hypothetical protein